MYKEKDQCLQLMTILKNIMHKTKSHFGDKEKSSLLYDREEEFNFQREFLFTKWKREEKQVEDAEPSRTTGKS